jgi:hypothetical protein
LFQDWIELYNPNAGAVDLTGYTLTDNPDVPGKWPFPAGTAIAPRGFLLIWADNQTAQNIPGGGLHAGFQLDNDGETIGLYNAIGVEQHSVTFGVQTDNVSSGLFPDGDISTVHPMSHYTPQSANSLAGLSPFVNTSLAGNVITLTWNSIPGRTYRLEFKNSPDDPAWTQLGADITATADTTSATDNAAVRRRFYRARRLE